MIDTSHKLPIVHQTRLLQLARSSVYYQPKAKSETDLALMRRIDELHLEHPFAGARMLRDMLRAASHVIGRKHVTTLMRKMGIEALYRRPNTSRRHAAHRIYPYLLRNLAIERPNQVWAMDITYLPMKRGFVYLAVVLDWASRRILSWRLSNTLTADFCVEALEQALARHGPPQIMNTDQGSQFSSSEFIGLLNAHGIAISMDGKGSKHASTARQRVRRAAVALGQVRGGLPACLRHGVRGQGQPGSLRDVLQRAPAP